MKNICERGLNNIKMNGQEYIFNLVFFKISMFEYGIEMKVWKWELLICAFDSYEKSWIALIFIVHYFIGHTAHFKRKLYQVDEFESTTLHFPKIFCYAVLKYM